MIARRSSRTYICITCRTARRAPAAWGLENPYRCASCGAGLWELGRKWRIPRKADEKGWVALKKMVEELRPLRREQLDKRGAELLGKLDEKVGAASREKPSELRDRKLRALEKERVKVVAEYFPAEARAGVWP